MAANRIWSWIIASESWLLESESSSGSSSEELEAWSEEGDEEEEEESESEFEEPDPPMGAPESEFEFEPIASARAEFEEPEPMGTPESEFEFEPIASKPMEETPKTKKPRSNASDTPRQTVRAGSKRPSESKRPKKKKIPDPDREPDHAREEAKKAGGDDSKRPSESDPNDSKRPKKKKIPDPDREPDHAREEVKKAGGDDSKKLFERIWSNDDEITILEGMIEYSKKGLNPYGDMVDFHNFIKNLLKADANKTQLQDKIRRLKKKHETNVAKGKKYNPVKPHELRVFSLSKKVWGSGEGSIAVSAGWRELGLMEGGLELIGEPKIAELKEEWKKLHAAELGLMGEPKRAGLIEDWKELHAAELELLVTGGKLMRELTKVVSRRGELMTEQAKLVRRG